MAYQLTVNCCLCRNKFDTEIDLPDGWAHRYGGSDDESNGFCPQHAIIAQFAKSQCPGCVGGWGDCPLWQAFAYRKYDLTSDDIAAIESGICPRRVNGTIGFSLTGGMEDIDLSDRAPTESGKALVEAIGEYVAEYGIEMLADPKEQL